MISLGITIIIILDWSYHYYIHYYPYCDHNDFSMQHHCCCYYCNFFQYYYYNYSATLFLQKDRIISIIH